MAEEILVKCGGCNKEVPDWDLDRWGECTSCRANERATDMGVGDLNTNR